MRTAFSACVIYSMFLLVNVGMSVSRLLIPSLSPDRPNLDFKRDLEPAWPAAKLTQSAPQVPWPHFLGGGGSAREISINGTPMINEEWDTASSPAEIIAYYKDQMAARGWSDVTEEAHGLQPDGRESNATKNGLQDEDYLKLYDSVISSSLVFNRGAWSMHVLTAQGKKFGTTKVRLCAAATPSLKDFFAVMAAGMNGDGNGSSRPIEAVQKIGGEQYHTRISSNSRDPAQAFQESLNDSRAEGWHPVLKAPRGQSKSEYFAWLSRGQQYAALSVKPAAQGRGSSITLTEVSPQ
jgi:hypothetical protein